MIKDINLSFQEDYMKDKFTADSREIYNTSALWTDIFSFRLGDEMRINLLISPSFSIVYAQRPPQNRAKCCCRRRRPRSLVLVHL